MTKPIKRRNAEASKQLILRSATELFSKKGYSSASLEELAKMCDLNKAMIFYYYKSKQGLYEAVIIEVLEEIYDAITRENNKHKTPTEELKSFIKTFANFSCSHPYLPALLLKELSDSGAQIPKKLFFHMRKLYTLFTEMLKRGEEEGCFKDIIPMIVYFMIMGTINLMITTKKLRIKAYELDNIDTCATCEIDEISDYLIKKIIKMLKD
ncbi:MAG: TetR/AcrR family transcriptional regulator [Campylobacteraceae bacterium]|nr:TetR/AcrR family transcriptional regulator [Campylobacteraceae bacterium]